MPNLQKIESFFKNGDQFARYINVELLTVKEGYAKAQLSIEQHHLNGANVVQGGAIFTLADFTFGVASNTHGFLSLGINVNISYIKSAKQGEILTAICQQKVQGKKLGAYEVEIHNQDGDIIALFSGLNYLKQQTIF